jgi:hypothetical protein
LDVHNNAFVDIREDLRTGRGLYTKRDHLVGDTLLSGVRPIVSGENYAECIGKILLQKTNEEIKGETSTMMAVAQLTYPLNLKDVVSAPDVASGTKSVVEFVNTHANGAFEIESLHTDVYLRLWGVMFLNALRSAPPISPASSSSSSSTIPQLRLYGSISLINHSCYPSCGLQFDGEEGSASVVVIAKSGLPAGRQVTINYVEQQAEQERWHKNKRKRHLHENYGIVCTANPTTCLCAK